MITSAERGRRFLQALWQNRLFDSVGLSLTDGTRFEIVSTGVRNDDNPNLPDFSFASIRLPDKGITLYGNIKIDTHSSHWREQGTINAPEFSSVILHIVSEQDITLTQGDRQIPTFALIPPEDITVHYDELRKGYSCPGYLGAMDSIHSNHILTRVMSDRLERKSKEVLEIYNSVGNDWHETAYICFVRAFGYRDKKQAFETLARTLPLRFLRLHSDSIAKIEALLLGQAGYLEIPYPDAYTRHLQDEYTELKKRHELYPRHISWRGEAVRPGSLPVQSLVRIAAILKEEDDFLNRVISAQSCDEFAVMFDVLLSEYWQEHLAPSRLSMMHSHGMTKQKTDLLIINFVIPFLTAYGIVTRNDEIRDRAIDLYEAIPPEVNRFTKHWTGAGYNARNAFFSQALIQLSTEYCTEGVCGSCPLGIHQLSEVFKKNRT